ncbi:Reticulon - like 1 [Theobroma cacao]|nr:Reticulon - like 1 [Theobroma cacao]
MKMNAAALRDAGMGVTLATAVNALLRAIAGVITTTKRFKPLLNHLNDTVNWITPRINEISRSTDSQEIERLLDLLNEAKEAVDKCARVHSWNYYKKYKFAKELIELDNSIRTTLQVVFPVMILGDTRQILDAVDELKLMFSFFFYIILEDFQSSARNTSGVIFDLIRSNVSFENLGLKKIAQSQPAEIVNDIALWKRKKLSGTLLFSSTATWLLQQVYQYNFITIASWVAIFIVTSLFIWRNGSMETTLFNLREEATKSRLENIREKVAMEVANACRELTDQIIGWIFHATDVEGEWFVFPQTVALLLIFSCVGSFFDLPTLCKGVMMGTTVPPMVAKHGDKMKTFGNMVRMQSGRVCEMVLELLIDAVINNRKKSKKQN